MGFFWTPRIVFCTWLKYRSDFLIICVSLWKIRYRVLLNVIILKKWTPVNSQSFVEAENFNLYEQTKIYQLWIGGKGKFCVFSFQGRLRIIVGWWMKYHMKISPTSSSIKNLFFANPKSNLSLPRLSDQNYIFLCKEYQHKIRTLLAKNEL